MIAGAQARALFHPDMPDRQIRNGTSKTSPALFGKIVDQILLPAAKTPLVERFFRYTLALVGEQHAG